MRIAKLLQPLDSELFSVAVEGIRYSIRAKKYRLARLQPQRQRFITRRGEQTRRNPAELQSGAPFRTGVKGAGHARAGDLQFLSPRIQDRMLDGRMPAGHPRIISRRFSVARTSCGEVPVLCTPRNVPTASAAYSAAGRPFPETSPRYKPTLSSVNSK